MPDSPHETQRVVQDPPDTAVRFRRYPAGHAKAGQEVVREHVCEQVVNGAPCGRTYKQWIVARFWREKCVDPLLPLAEQAPDGIVPRWCPRCESRELGRIAARRHEAPPARRAW